jgi:hypothetical protein
MSKVADTGRKFEPANRSISKPSSKGGALQ